jgi:uncharacterized membrane protein
MRKTIYLVIISSLIFFNLLSCIKNNSIPPQNCVIGVMGPKYANVKSLLQLRCVRCHNATLQNGGNNRTNDCDIIFEKDNILQATQTDFMPLDGPKLTPDEKNIIAVWVNAGGKYTD